MAKTFGVEKLSVPDSDSDVEGTIKDWIDGLNIPTDNTVYSVNVVHLKGFYEVLIIYEL